MSLARRIQNLQRRLFQQKRTDDVAPEERLLSTESKFFVKEAYKALRTNMIFSLTEEGSKIIMITSSRSAEGKSTNCMNLAITFAETGAKVCVVDADMRKPKIAKLNQEKGTPGLSNVLARLNKLDEVIRPSKYQNLDIVYSGNIPPNPAELLASEKMTKIMKELETRYDYIFVDTPPVNVVTDAALLAGQMHGVLFVVRQNETTKEDLAEALQQMEMAKAKVLGVLFNDIKPSASKSYRYRYSRRGYYRNNYYYYYRMSSKEE